MIGGSPKNLLKGQVSTSCSAFENTLPSWKDNDVNVRREPGLIKRRYQHYIAPISPEDSRAQNRSERGNTSSNIGVGGVVRIHYSRVTGALCHLYRFLAAYK